MLALLFPPAVGGALSEERVAAKNEARNGRGEERRRIQKWETRAATKVRKERKTKTFNSTYEPTVGVGPFTWLSRV